MRTLCSGMDPPLASRFPTQTTPAHGAEGKTLFVVEDDEAARESAAALLETMGYRVSTFASAEEFLDYVTLETKGFLLLDYRFEGMSGLDLIDSLRQRLIFVPVILFTGLFDSSVRRRARAYEEIVEVLDKPLNLDCLQRALDQAAALAERHASA